MAMVIQLRSTLSCWSDDGMWLRGMGACEISGDSAGIPRVLNFRNDDIRMWRTQVVTHMVIVVG
jgi:hypothetical protein